VARKEHNQDKRVCYRTNCAFGLYPSSGVSRTILQKLFMRVTDRDYSHPVSRCEVVLTHRNPLSHVDKELFSTFSGEIKTQLFKPVFEN